jgi:hypothetical protein
MTLYLLLALVTEVVSVSGYLIGFLDDKGTAGVAVGLQFHQGKCCVGFSGLFV